VGIQNKPIYETKHYSTGYPYKNKIGEREIVRGIEVKCSKADFKNGYSLTGCNYNYILAPLGLIKKSDLPKDMGFLEYNKHKFQGRLGSDFKYVLSGLKITKKPRFQENPTEDQINRYVWRHMNSRIRSLCVQYIGKELQQENIDEYTRYRNYIVFKLRNGQWKAEFNTYSYPRVQGIGNTPEAAIIDLLTINSKSKRSEGDE